MLAPRQMPSPAVPIVSVARPIVPGTRASARSRHAATDQDAVDPGLVDSLTTNNGGGGRKINIGAYPTAPTSSYATLTETSRSHDPANETLQQSTYSVTLNSGQQIHLDLRVYAGASPTNLQLRWVPPDDQTQSINAALAAAKSARKVILFAYDEGTEGCRTR